MSTSPSNAAYPWRPREIVVGRVGRPHGLDGALKLEGHGGSVPLAAGTKVTVGGRPATVAERRGTAERPILRLDIAASREAAEALRGSDVTVLTSTLPEPDEDEFFHIDLVGCEVFAGAHAIGKVTTVHSYPANDVLELAGVDGAVLVPFSADVVHSVDLPARRIDVREDFL